jgi:hypothetical protein
MSLLAQQAGATDAPHPGSRQTLEFLVPWTEQKLPKSQINVLRWSIWRGGHRQPDLRPVSSHRQRFASHQFDRWPVLTEEARCVVEIARLHANTAGLSAGSVRYLKVKIEADCFRIFFDRLIIAPHLVSPPFCVAHIRFMILIFVGRDCGALECVNLVVLGTLRVREERRVR